MQSYNRLFSAKYRNLSAPVLLLILSSTLFACGQTETIDVANSPKTDAVQNEKLTAVTVPTSNPALLKNVSATVYKDIDCGCCKEWIDHAQSNGMSTTAQHPKDLALFKDRYGVPNDMRSCHTTVTTDGYVFEGHVPAKYVAEFLANPPIQALGLAVPGMPMGSPGMEYQNQFMPYQVMQINKDGSSEVYASIETSDQQL
ncbi:DUF411 domain-containing protein [Psychrobacter sp. TAE2020]|uniref:DUF411 domain-containing protein n=1 Tax=Psychrobacter sp. TAE2020 TaxID=2846762 RepID=UPI001C115938|nr:DUF411 domain-containing protein [Psychrobacter sp. TAE2020]MBU5616284.1 DUF411 domain-containing protein [Psychrobacter sp. TAE2020]